MGSNLTITLTSKDASGVAIETHTIVSPSVLKAKVKDCVAAANDITVGTVTE